MASPLPSIGNVAAHGQTNSSSVNSTPQRSYHMGGEIVGRYVLGRVLGAGDFDSRTRLCHDTETGQEYAVKIYDKEVLSNYTWMWEQVRDSVHIMRTLPKHENLIEMVECFETQSSLYILMQMHAPLRVSRIYTVEGPPIPLNRSRQLFAQTVRGILHLHDHNVAHLGLAPDHVMVNHRGQVKIGNLVSCRTITADLITDMRGTTRTVAPEVLAGEAYDPRLADAWALGVLLYFMMASGRYPHDGANTTKHILANTIRPLPEHVDHEARDLIHRLLQLKPRKRMSVHEILSHPFFEENSDVDWSGGAAGSGGEEGFASDGNAHGEKTNTDGEGGFSSDEGGGGAARFFSRIARAAEKKSGGGAQNAAPTTDPSSAQDQKRNTFNSATITSIFDTPSTSTTTAAAEEVATAANAASSSVFFGERPTSSSRAADRSSRRRSSVLSAGKRRGSVGARSNSSDSQSQNQLPPQAPTSRRRSAAAASRSNNKALSSAAASSSAATNKSAVRAYWSERDGLTIVLPEGLPKEEEAAYLIQHTYRLYLLKKEEHWDLKITKQGRLGQLLQIRRVGNGNGGKGRGRDADDASTRRKRSFSYGVAEKALATSGATPDDFAAVGGMSAISGIFDLNRENLITADSDSAEISSSVRTPKTFRGVMGGENSTNTPTNFRVVNRRGSSQTTAGSTPKNAQTAAAAAAAAEQAYLLGLQQGLALAQQQLLMGSGVGVGVGDADGGTTNASSRATSATHDRSAGATRRTTSRGGGGGVGVGVGGGLSRGASRTSLPQNDDHRHDSSSSSDGEGEGEADEGGVKQGTYFRGMRRGGEGRRGSTSKAPHHRRLSSSAITDLNATVNTLSGEGGGGGGGDAHYQTPLVRMSPSALVTCPTLHTPKLQTEASSAFHTPRPPQHHAPQTEGRPHVTPPPPPPPFLANIPLSPRFMEQALMAAAQSLSNSPAALAAGRSPSYGTPPFANVEGGGSSASTSTAAAAHFSNNGGGDRYTTPFSPSAGLNNSSNINNGSFGAAAGNTSFFLMNTLGGGGCHHNNSFLPSTPHKQPCFACGRSAHSRPSLFSSTATASGQNKPFPTTNFSFTTRGRNGRGEFRDVRGEEDTTKLNRATSNGDSSGNALVTPPRAALMASASQPAAAMNLPSVQNNHAPQTAMDGGNSQQQSSFSNLFSVPAASVLNYDKSSAAASVGVGSGLVVAQRHAQPSQPPPHAEMNPPFSLPSPPPAGSPSAVRSFLPRTSLGGTTPTSGRKDSGAAVGVAVPVDESSSARKQHARLPTLFTN